MHYVYILRSLIFPDQIYVGCTINYKARLASHNSGKSPHTAKYKPWKMISCILFEDEIKAKSFEEYLKSGSGNAFMKKRLI